MREWTSQRNGFLLNPKVANTTNICSASTRKRWANNNCTTIWRPRNSMPMHSAKILRRWQKWNRREATGMFNYTTIWPCYNILDTRSPRPKRMTGTCWFKWAVQTWLSQQRIVPAHISRVSTMWTPPKRAAEHHMSTSRSRPSNKSCRRKTLRPNRTRISG